MIIKLHKFTIILLSITASVTLTLVSSEEEIRSYLPPTTLTPHIVNKSEEVTPTPNSLDVSTDGQNGNKFGCVPFFKCDPKTKLLKKHDVDVMNISSCSESEKCEGRYDVCCQVSSNNPTITTLNSDAGNGKEVISNSSSSCACVLYYLCNDGFVDSNKGVHLFSRRRRRSPEDDVCQNDNDVCCQIDDKKTTFPLNWTGCGHRNPDGVGAQSASTEDNASKFGEFPWMAAILRKERVDGKIVKVFQCGGTLIHPQVAVTTAGCITDTDKRLIVRVGEWDVSDSMEGGPYPRQDRDVSTITVHPQFNDGSLHNDIALLFLKDPVNITETVDSICLPPLNAVFDHDTRCFVSGWGKDHFGKEGNYQQILKKVDLPIVANGPCQKALRNTRLGIFFELHNSFICAGGEGGKDTCRGDGGGPLVCPIAGHENRYVLAGMVSWGIVCGEKGIPGVYTNVALYRDWIDQEMVINSLDWKSYQY